MVNGNTLNLFSFWLRCNFFANYNLPHLKRLMVWCLNRKDLCTDWVIDYINLLAGKSNAKVISFSAKTNYTTLVGLTGFTMQNARAIRALSTNRGGMESDLNAISGVVPRALCGLEW